jgi:hypothetical protein
MGIVFARGRLRSAAEDFAAFLVENAGPMPGDDEESVAQGAQGEVEHGEAA